MATQQQDQPTAKRGKGRPPVAVKHKPCAFTYTIFAEYLLELQNKGISTDKAKKVAIQGATTAIQQLISEQQNNI